MAKFKISKEQFDILLNSLPDSLGRNSTFTEEFRKEFLFLFHNTKLPYRSAWESVANQMCEIVPTPFDLQRARNGDKVVTKDGRTFIFGGYNPDALEYYQVLGWIDGCTYSCSTDGRCWNSSWAAPSPIYLFMA